jgi:hypothetical protein
MKECFLHLEEYPGLPKKFKLEATTNIYKLHTKDPANPSSFSACGSFANKFLQTPLYQSLVAEYNNRSPNNTFKNPSNSVVHPVYVKVGPMQVYDWHTDVERTCAINVLLTTETPVYTLFREQFVDLFYNIKHLPYVVNRPYLFDTSVEHSIINLTNSDRILLTVGIYGPSYDEVREFLLTSKNYY